jgi:hypothetical protein
LIEAVKNHFKVEALLMLLIPLAVFIVGLIISIFAPAFMR